MHETFCVRGTACEDPIAAVDPDTGEKCTTGAHTRNQAPFCDTCLRFIRYTLGYLPGDVAELTTLLVPSMQVVAYRDPDMPTQPRTKKHPPLPLDGNAEALRALIDHEITTWAELVAAETGVAWDSHEAAHQRLGMRVQRGCQLLAHRLEWLLGIPAQEYECRSTGEHPTDGHDLDQVTYDGRRYWLRRDGIDAALLFLDLHRQVERFTGRAPSDRCPVPCPHCRRQALHRVHARTVVAGGLRHGTAGQVVCRSCWREMSDDDYERLSDVISTAFGVAW